LSISETATFCQVCGARVEAQAVVPAVVSPESVAAPELTAELQPPAAAPAEAESEFASGQSAAAEPAPGLTGQPESGDDAADRRLAEVSSLLDAAAACEDGDPAAAAGLLRESILVCLEPADDPLASERVCRDLLCGFDRLSALLQREGLTEEALEVADDAALLGLLSGRDHAAAWHRDALRDRREDLRRTLFVDSAQL
jgi:hypothetical protein